jgi:hypothetical protein
MCVVTFGEEKVILATTKDKTFNEGKISVATIEWACQVPGNAQLPTRKKNAIRLDSGSMCRAIHSFQIVIGAQRVLRGVARQPIFQELSSWIFHTFHISHPSVHNCTTLTTVSPPNGVIDDGFRRRKSY